MGITEASGGQLSDLGPEINHPVMMCPSCGSDTDLWTGACGLCGVGTEVDLGNVRQSFYIPEDARELILGENPDADFQPMDLIELIGRLKYFYPEEAVVVMFNDVPVVSTPELDSIEIRKNFSYINRRIKRANEGYQWIKALCSFNELREIMNRLGDEDREEVQFLYFWGDENRSVDEREAAFFSDPTFANIEELMMSQLFLQDADRLRAVNMDLEQSLSILSSTQSSYS